MLGKFLAVSVVVAAASLVSVPAFGAAQVVTETVHNQTETFHDEVPCVGVGDITITYNGVEHVTETSDGFHETFTQTGTFSVVLDAGGTSTGRFTIWGGFNTADGINGTGTFTFSGTVRTGVGAGTSWNSVSHFTGALDEATDPKVAFDKFSCH